MTKTLDEIKAVNDALEQQKQLKEYLRKLTSDQDKLESMSTKQLRKEYEDTFTVLQKIENTLQKQKGDVLKGDKELNASTDKLSDAIDASSRKLDLMKDTIFGSLSGFKGFAQAAGGAAFTAAIGWKGLSKALGMYGRAWDGMRKPFLESTSAIVGQFGEAKDASGKFTDGLAGNFARGESEIMDLVGSSARGLNATGTSMGYFSADLTTALKQVTDGLGSLRTAAKDNLYLMEKEISEAVSGKQLILFQKILGATEEDMSSFAGRAQIMGSSIRAQMAVARQSAEDMAEAFGMKGMGKVIATSMNALRNDFRNFGTFSEAQLAKVTAQSMKLGISLDGIKKLNMYDDFDKAAESAAMLGQSFGLNIDAFDLFMEEDPSERLRMIQEAARNAGLDIANMSRVEMNYLSDLTGMGVEDTMKALSEGGLEMQSQLGEVPDVAKSAQEQTAQLIKAQEGIAGTLQTFQKDLPTFIDNAATVAKNLGETGLLRGTTLKKAGEAIGQSFADVTSSTLKLVMSDAVKEASSVMMKTLLGAKIGEKGRFQGGALQVVTKQATGGIKIAEGIATATTEGLKEGKNPGEILKDAAEKAAPGAKEFGKGSRDMGALGQGIGEAVIDATTGKKKTPAPPKPETPDDLGKGGADEAIDATTGAKVPDPFDLFMEETPIATAATPQAAEAPATPSPAKQPKPKVDAKAAGSPPAPAGDVTVNTKSDGAGQLRGEANVPLGTQKIVIMIGEKEVGEAVLRPVMTADFPVPNVPSTAGTVGGVLSKANQATP